MRSTTQALLATAAAVLTVAGCGSSKHPATTAATSSAGPATTQPSPAVRAAIDGWAKANTGRALCSLMSYGYKLGIAHGLHQSPSNCAANAAKTFKLTSSTAHIISVADISGQTRVIVSFSGGKPQALWLVRECGRMKVNSVNAYEPHPPPPPSC